MDQAAEITPALEKLQIDEDTSKRILDALVHPESYISQEGDLIAIQKLLNSPKTLPDLLEILKNNPTAYIEGLKTIGDVRGHLLCELIARYGSDKQQDTAKTVLKCLISLFKVSPTTQWYITAYYLVADKFDVTVPDHLDIMLNHIGPTFKSEPDVVHATILLITIKGLKLSPKLTTETITAYLEYIIDEDPIRLRRSLFLNLILVLDSLFPLVPVNLSTLYMSDKCKDMLLSYILNISASSLKDPENYKTVCCVLKLVSTSCIDEQVRNFNVATYIGPLIAGAQLNEKAFEEAQILSTLCIVKLWNNLPKDLPQIRKDISLESLLVNITEALRHKSKHTDHIVETLAYLSLNNSFREKLRADSDSISTMVDILKTSDPHSSLIYGVLTTLSNLSKFQYEDASNRSRTVNFLKSYTDPAASKEKQDPAKVLTFSKSLLEDYNIVAVFTKLKVSSNDVQEFANSINQVITILYSISCNMEKKVRQELVLQGALTLVLNYLISFSTVGPKSVPTSLDAVLLETRLSALRALAKMLVSVNPSLAFNKYNVSTCVPFLVEMLGQDITNYNGIQVDKELEYLTQMTQKDKYESLLALTNVLSVEEQHLKKLIGSKTFAAYLDNFIIDSDEPLIQRAAWELLSNLISEPSVLVYFFNIEKKANYQRLDLMIKLLNSNDEKLQTAIAGLLANASSEFQMVSEIIFQTKDIWGQVRTNAIEILEKQTEVHDLVHRILYILLGVAYVANELGGESLAHLQKDKKLKTAMATVLRSGSSQAKEVAVDIIKAIMFL